MDGITLKALHSRDETNLRFPQAVFPQIHVLVADAGDGRKIVGFGVFVDFPENG